MEPTCLDALGSEIEMLQGIFEEGEVVESSHEHTDNGYYVKLTVPMGIVVDVRVSPVGYPNESRPAVYVKEAPNATHQTNLERTLSRRIESELELGSPMLALVALMVREEAERIETEMKAGEEARNERREKDSERQRQLEEELAQVEKGCRAQMVTPSGIRILSGEPIADRKSKFLAHVAPVASEREAMEVVAELRGNKWIAAACHPSIYAYRFRDTAKGIISQDAEDDGETAAAKKILFLLEQAGVEGYIVVVTRWFGGILLGPDRFKHIMECSRQALVQHGIMKPR